VFPVGLMAAGRACLVVGGGKIALRKTRLLLDARARVTVVSPELHPELTERIREGMVHYEARAFDPADVRGQFLVFAATNDADVNREILTCCREAGVYGCSIDNSWVDGDFVTPASFRKGELTVSVSTGGKSCRRSKLVKDSLARHVEMVDTAGLIVMGTSHNYLPIREREPFHLTGCRLVETGNMVMQVWGVHEFVILNTCNRIELIAVVTQSHAVEAVLKRIFGLDRLNDDGFYLKRDADAFGHMAVMTAGLLSQTPGENHIVAQVKDAVAEAADHGWAAGMLQQWLSSVLHIAKDIRRETDALLRHHEIEDLCIQYLAAEVPDWASQCVLVVGAGVVGAGIVKSLVGQGRAVTWCYHRNKPELSGEANGSVKLCGMNALRDEIASAGVIVCATSSEGHVLHMGHAPFFDQERRTVVVDLAMPRNVAPALNGIADSIRVVDLDDLKHWYRREVADMARIFEVSKAVIDEHRDMYDKLIQSFQGRDAE
jgi:precorrin-2 dehydrogenase/sirohydrochlorin ferrochelatase